MAHVTASSSRLGLGVALVAQGSTLVANEAQVGQLLVTHVTAEASGMPIGVHCLDHTSGHELA
jgi:hypothetical protein